MFRALTVLAAVVALAVSAQPASAGVKQPRPNALSADTDSDGISDGYEASRRRSCTLRMYASDGSPTAKYYLD
jgi:hypothetical protein